MSAEVANVEQCPYSESDILQTKKGESLLVEQATQNIITNPFAADEIIGDVLSDIRNNFDRLIPLHRRTPDQQITVDYQLARNYRQIVISSLGGIANLSALPKITQQHREYRSLRPPRELGFNVYEVMDAYEGRSTNRNHFAHEYIKAMNGTYWFMEAVSDTMEDIASSGHYYHQLHKHVATHRDQYIKSINAWLLGPGINRWPSRDTKPTHTEHSLLDSYSGNMELGLDFAQMYFAHHLLHKNAFAHAMEVHEGLAEAMLLVDQLASTDRHITWRPDWRWALKMGWEPGHVPHHPDLRLIRAILNPDSESEETFLKTLSQFPITTNESFLPHPSLRNGRWIRAKKCPGDVAIIYPDSEDTAIAREYFDEMGCPDFIDDQGRFTLSSTVLAAAKKAAESTFLSSYTIEKIIDSYNWRLHNTSAA